MTQRERLLEAYRILADMATRKRYALTRAQQVQIDRMATDLYKIIQTLPTPKESTNG